MMMTGESLSLLENGDKEGLTRHDSSPTSSPPSSRPSSWPLHLPGHTFSSPDARCSPCSYYGLGCPRRVLARSRRSRRISCRQSRRWCRGWRRGYVGCDIAGKNCTCPGNYGDEECVYESERIELGYRFACVMPALVNQKLLARERSRTGQHVLLSIMLCSAK